MENNIKKFLDGRPITWLSKITGIGRTTIYAYINGTEPSLKKAYKIADAFGVTVYEVWPWLSK